MTSHAPFVRESFETFVFLHEGNFINKLAGDLHDLSLQIWITMFDRLVVSFTSETMTYTAKPVTTTTATEDTIIACFKLYIAARGDEWECYVFDDLIDFCVSEGVDKDNKFEVDYNALTHLWHAPFVKHVMVKNCHNGILQYLKIVN